MHDLPCQVALQRLFCFSVAMMRWGRMCRAASVDLGYFEKGIDIRISRRPNLTRPSCQIKEIYAHARQLITFFENADACAPCKAATGREQAGSPAPPGRHAWRTVRYLAIGFGKRFGLMVGLVAAVMER
ncbi:MAG TPA: hypothetical protein DCZ75_06780 [Geobacter sp.]|nr:hypothetical protein [Geobacter sp.]